MQIENLVLFRDLGSIMLLDLGFIGVAYATQLDEQTPDASRYGVKLIAAATKLNEQIKSTRLPVYQMVADKTLARARQDLGPEAVDAAWAEGYAMDWPQAIAYALSRTPSSPPARPSGK